MFWVRMVLVAVLAVAVIGPAPLQGVRELASITMERTAQWSAFAKLVRSAYRAVSQKFKDANRRGVARR